MRAPNYEIVQDECSILIFVHIQECISLRNTSDFLSGFSEQERTYIETKASGADSLSARYAAKIGAEIISRIPWNQFEVARSNEGAPQLIGRSLAASNYLKLHPVLLSLAHDEPLAIAYLYKNS